MTWGLLAPFQERKKIEKTYHCVYFVTRAYFRWLYKVDEARTSLAFLHILKYSIKGTSISNIFVLDDLRHSWRLTEKRKKLEKSHLSIMLFPWHILDGSTRLMKQEKVLKSYISWSTLLKVIELEKIFVLNDLSDSWWPSEKKENIGTS